MRKGSIAARIFLFSAAWLVVALVATAFLLTELYSRALDNSLLETLDFQIDSLVGSALQDGPANLPQEALGDPRFSRPASGWYWEVRDASGQVLGYSSSLIGSALPSLDPQSGTMRRTARLNDAFGTQIRMLERRISLEDESYLFVATGNLDEIAELVAAFRGQTLIVLGAVGVMLAIMSALVARFALRPVTRLRTALERVRAGEAERVGGSYPTELAPLAEEVNELLRSNAQIIERARSQVGNLAHGLKTPIAVLRNEAETDKGSLARIVMTETEKMTAMVATYLDRSRLSARTAVVGRKADAGKMLDRLVRVMGKIHPARTITLDQDAQTLPWFRGEEGDFEEMVGNLLDNACKWARNRVSVSARPAPAAEPALTVVIEDDGPGLGPDQIGKALERGARLDEKTPGSGLGLDIVKELVDVYGGSLHLSRSDMGGLRAELILPAVRPRS